jgi:hypothetical protein
VCFVAKNNSGRKKVVDVAQLCCNTEEALDKLHLPHHITSIGSVAKIALRQRRLRVGLNLSSYSEQALDELRLPNRIISASFRLKIIFATHPRTALLQ